MKLYKIISIIFVTIYLCKLANSQSSLFRSFENPESTFGNNDGGPNSELTSIFNNNNNNFTTSGGLIWQPLRATFRPLNRQQAPTPPSPPLPPTPPTPPSPPPPPPPEPLALTSNREPETSSSDFLATINDQPTILTTTTSTTTAAPIINLDEEDLPTRNPLNSFRPTKPPSVDLTSNQPSSLINSIANSGSQNVNNNNNNNTNYRITNECFECICEASTSCNLNSRCQTSDVRHTRCGMFLISYDQWLDTNLSKQLVTREALNRDPAADERAFYECVTDKECAGRLLTIYMQKNSKDCDKDGRIDCYDIAAIHQGGLDQCNSENLLDSQYWSDFNACFGFGR